MNNPNSHTAKGAALEIARRIQERSNAYASGERGVGNPMPEAAVVSALESLYHDVMAYAASRPDGPADNGSWKARYEEEYAIVDRIWKALGCHKYEDAKGQAIAWLNQHAEDACFDLRDHFAAEAIVECIRVAADQTPGEAHLSTVFDKAAGFAYFVADSMLKHRAPADTTGAKG